MADMNADNLAEHDNGAALAPGEGGKGPDLGHLAFQRRGTLRDTHGPDIHARRGFYAEIPHLIHLGGIVRGTLVHHFSQRLGRQIVNEFAGLLAIGERVVAGFAGEGNDRGALAEEIEETERRKVAHALRADRADPADRAGGHDRLDRIVRQGRRMGRVVKKRFVQLSAVPRSPRAGMVTPAISSGMPVRLPSGGFIAAASSSLTPGALGKGHQSRYNGALPS